MLTGQAVLPRGRPYSADVACPYRTRGGSRRRHVAGPYGGHVASPGRDTCRTDLAFLACGRTNMEVTRVTTHRVTHGTLTSSVTWHVDRANDVA
jgi:hypothetical protein